MKTNRLILSAAALLLALPAARAQIVTGNEAVRVEVRMQSEQDRKDLPKTTADTVTQHKALLIALSGKPKSPETRTGKWTAYGRDLKSKDVTVLDSGEFKVDLANGQQTVESKRVNTTYTPEHATVSSSRGGGSRGGTSKAKKVAAAGSMFIGYEVVVKDGEKVVGEYFDPPGLKGETAR